MSGINLWFIIILFREMYINVQNTDKNTNNNYRELRVFIITNRSQYKNWDKNLKIFFVWIKI